MANSVKIDAAAGQEDLSDQPEARTAAAAALIEAAKQLLPSRVPSTVTGRELAKAADVNYGLIHHYFGSKQAVFREAILELRDDFIRRHPELDPPGLLEHNDPYVLALGRSQIDYPNELGSIDTFPIGRAIVDGLLARAAERGDDLAESDAKATALALLAMQLGYGLFHAALEASVGVDDADRATVREALDAIYRQLRES